MSVTPSQDVLSELVFGRSARMYCSMDSVSVCNNGGFETDQSHIDSVHHNVAQGQCLL